MHRPTTDRLRLSVHVAPRLVNDDGSDTERKLGEFPAFDRLGRRARNALRFEVAFDGGAVGGGDPRRRRPTRALWEPPLPAGDAASARTCSRTTPSATCTSLPVTAAARRSCRQPTAPPARSAPTFRRSTTPSDRWRISRRWRHPRPGRSDSQLLLRGAGPARMQPHEGNGKVVHENLASSAADACASRRSRTTFFEAYRFYHRPGQPAPRSSRRLHRAVAEVPHDFEFHERASARSPTTRRCCAGSAS